MKRRTAVGTKIGAVVAGTALALSGVGTTASAGAATGSGSAMDSLLALADFPAFATIADSLGSTAPVVLHGKLSEVAGAPMGGAVVLLSAWPSNEVVSKLPIGDSFALTPIARAVASPDGTYELRSALTPVLAGLVGEDGLDVEFDVFAAGRQYRYLSQVTPVGAARWARQLVGEMALARGSAGNLLDVALDRRVSAGLRNPFNDDGDLPHPPEPWCTDWSKVDELEAPTTVATAVARPGATALVKYDHGARTETTLGMSVGGGVFSPKGSRTRESHLFSDWGADHAGPGQVINQEYKVNEWHGIFQARCARSYPYRGELPDVWRASSPERLSGGVFPVPSRLPLWTCGEHGSHPEPANAAEVGTDNEKAETYTAGFSFPANKWGSFTGEATSGYDDKTGVHFKFDDRKRAYWCGDSGDPLSAGQRVQGFER